MLSRLTRSTIPLVLSLAVALVVPAPLNAAGKALTRAQALEALTQPVAAQRGAAVVRLAEIGTMDDTQRLVLRLDDSDEAVRQLAEAALWQIWGRSGDATIDAQYQRGVAQMAASRLGDAVASFTAIIQKKPAFAEAWNKRATVYYLLGQFELSMKDCDEVLKRNPNHFGALSGYAQMWAQKGDPARALDYYQRALKVHPHLGGAEQVVPQLEREVEEKIRRTI